MTLNLFILLSALIYTFQSFTPCVRFKEKPTFPCTIFDTIYKCAEENACGSGSYGQIYKVIPIEPQVTTITADGQKSENTTICAMKFSTATRYAENPNIINEVYVSQTMMNLVEQKWGRSELETPPNTLPTVLIYDSDIYYSGFQPKRTVMVTEYYPYGNIFNIEQLKEYWPLMVEHRDEYVFKMLHDISFVLENLWKKEMIDRDVHGANIMISGDLSHWHSTTFVKIDYGMVVSKNNAERELAHYQQRSNFCHYGRNASPLDVRVMYGKEFKKNYTAAEMFDAQLEQIAAAEIMSNHLESIDLIDLVITAIDFYNKLTINEADKINLEWSVADYSEKSRRYVVEYNYYQLHQLYKQPKYVYAAYSPETVKDMLIKLQWETYRQLPENYRGDQIKHQDYQLDWNLFNYWLDCISESVLTFENFVI